MNIITTENETHRKASGLLNGRYEIEKISTRAPVARFLGSEDVPNPPAPAWYVPQTSDIYIHADEAGIDTADFLIKPHTGFNAHKTLGLLAHETAHSAISHDLTTAERQAPHHGALLEMIEEVRVENHAIRRSPGVRVSLRAAFTIVLEAIRGLEPSDKATVARAWALVHGRTLAGVATPDETKPLDEAARILLGDDTVDALIDLLQEAVTLILPHQTDRLIEICDEWVELVGTPKGGDDGGDGCAAEPDGSGAKGTPRKGTPGPKGDKSEGGGRGDGADKSDEEGDGADGGDAIDGGTPGEGSESDDSDDGDYDLGVRDSVHGSDPMADDDEEDDEISEEGRELTDAALKTLSEQMADEWSASPPDSLHLTPSIDAARVVFGRKRRSTVLHKVEPKAGHRKAVLKVSAALSNLALPAVSKIAHPSVLPPGRLRSREAVRASAERTMGSMVTAEPWRGSKRRHSVARPLVIGIATDTSGSMKWAQKTVADFAYVYTNAGHRIGARTAAVTFGDHVYAIAKPGEVMSHVIEKEADDGTESAELAMAALDGVLRLSLPSPAARILIIVSDGCFVNYQETEKVEKWLERFIAAGTHILWVGSSASPMSTDWVEKLGTRHKGSITYVAPGRATGFERINEVVLKAINESIR